MIKNKNIFQNKNKLIIFGFITITLFLVHLGYKKQKSVLAEYIWPPRDPADYYVNPTNWGSCPPNSSVWIWILPEDQTSWTFSTNADSWTLSESFIDPLLPGDASCNVVQTFSPSGGQVTIPFSGNNQCWQIDGVKGTSYGGGGFVCKGIAGYPPSSSTATPTATVSSGPGPGPGPVEDVTIIKTADKTTDVIQGDTITFTITVNNTSASTKKFLVIDILPDNFGDPQAVNPPLYDLLGTGDIISYGYHDISPGTHEYIYTAEVIDTLTDCVFNTAAVSDVEYTFPFDLSVRFNKYVLGLCPTGAALPDLGGVYCYNDTDQCHECTEADTGDTYETIAECCSAHTDACVKDLEFDFTLESTPTDFRPFTKPAVWDISLEYKICDQDFSNNYFFEVFNTTQSEQVKEIPLMNDCSSSFHVIPDSEKHIEAIVKHSGYTEISFAHRVYYKNSSNSKIPVEDLNTTKATREKRGKLSIDKLICKDSGGAVVSCTFEINLCEWEEECQGLRSGVPNIEFKFTNTKEFNDGSTRNNLNLNRFYLVKKVGDIKNIIGDSRSSCIINSPFTPCGGQSPINLYENYEISELTINNWDSSPVNMEIKVTEVEQITWFDQGLQFLLPHVFAQMLDTITIPDAKVQLFSGGVAVGSPLYTSPLGSVVLQTEPGTYQILITKPGYKDITATWQAEEYMTYRGKFETELGTGVLPPQDDHIVVISGPDVTPPPIELEQVQAKDLMQTDTLLASDLQLRENILSNYINFFLTWLYGIAGAVAVLVLMLLGLRLMGSKGKPAEIKVIRQRMQYALVGLCLIFLAWIFTSYIQQQVVFQWTLQMQEQSQQATPTPLP